MQLLLGWRMHHTSQGDFLFGPVLDIAMCLLLLGCMQSSVMTLLNHIGVSTMGAYAYTVRAAGSAGYMAALLIMGLFGGGDILVRDNHLFIGSMVSVIHAALAFLAWKLLPDDHAENPSRDASPSDGEELHAEKKRKPSWSSQWEWFGLLLLVWMVGVCEMSYGLYAHEFLTTTYGNNGYFIFAGAVAIEIGVLVAMPYAPKLKKQLLFVGPLGWILLFSGCLIATQGYGAFGLFGLALALNCPFQISANEHAHRMNSSVMGVASMTLAQSLGYMTATICASVVSRFGAGPAPLWLLVLPLAVLALVLALRKLAQQDSALDVDDFGQPKGVSGGGAVYGSEERSHDFESGLGADDACSDAEDVHVIVLDALASGVSVMAKTSTNSGKLVRRHANANT